ncbi:hypothetical protein BGZ83_011593 [Gryganskiella cystojenkinii]|nr:hypothetical protein BGZ83_011593 [Gryganskiella cystojenkinii]
MLPYQQPEHPPRLQQQQYQGDIIEEAVDPTSHSIQDYQQQQQQHQQQQHVNNLPHNLYLYEPTHDSHHPIMHPTVPPEAHIVDSVHKPPKEAIVDGSSGTSGPSLEASCSSSMTTMPTEAQSYTSRASSIFGSIFQQKLPQHVRKSSSVLGWDSDDDEELDQATMMATATATGAGTAKHLSEGPLMASSTDGDLPPMSEKSPWLHKEQVKRKQVKTCLCLGVTLCFLILGVILVFTLKEQMAKGGIHGPRSNKDDHDNNNGGGDDPRKHLYESIEAIYHVNKTINHDPRLSNVFYGLDYTPRYAQEPNCKVNLGNVIEDIKILSQLTNRIRLYGMACRQTEYVLKAIEYLGLEEMQVILTLWVDHNRAASWERQSKIFWHLIDNELQMDASNTNSDGLQTATSNSVQISKIASRIIGISVGNEVLFRNENENKPGEHVPLETLFDYITQIRSGLAQRAAAAAASSDPVLVAQGSKLAQIPVFSSDLGRNAHQVVDQVDMVLSNIHPFFAYTSVIQAADWAFKNFRDETLLAAAGKPAVISEVGWPSGPPSAKLGSAVPSMANLQTFLDTWVCQANRNNVPYYYFEAFDEPWKKSINAREAQWGLMTVDRQLKVNIPVC